MFNVRTKASTQRRLPSSSAGRKAPRTLARGPTPREAARSAAAPRRRTVPAPTTPARNAKPAPAARRGGSRAPAPKPRTGPQRPRQPAPQRALASGGWSHPNGGKPYLTTHQFTRDYARFEGTDLLTTISMSGFETPTQSGTQGPGTVLLNILIEAISLIADSRMQQFVQLFEKFRFRRLRIRWIPSTKVAGSLLGVFIPDPNAVVPVVGAAANLTIFDSLSNADIVSVDGSKHAKNRSGMCCWDMDMKLNTGPFAGYFYNDNTTPELRTACQGQFALMVQDSINSIGQSGTIPQTAIYGDLMIDYDIELSVATNQLDGTPAPIPHLQRAAFWVGQSDNPGPPYANFSNIFSNISGDAEFDDLAPHLANSLQQNISSFLGVPAPYNNVDVKVQWSSLVTFDGFGIPGNSPGVVLWFDAPGDYQLTLLGGSPTPGDAGSTWKWGAQTTVAPPSNAVIHSSFSTNAEPGYTPAQLPALTVIFTIFDTLTDSIVLFPTPGVDAPYTSVTDFAITLNYLPTYATPTSFERQEYSRQLERKGRIPSLVVTQARKPKRPAIKVTPKEPVERKHSVVSLDDIEDLVPPPPRTAPIPIPRPAPRVKIITS